MSFIRKIILALALVIISASAAVAAPFVITLSSNGSSRTFMFDNAEDVIETFSGSSLDQLLPTYTPGSAATASLSLRGLDVFLSFDAGSPTLNLNVPSIGLVRSFTGANRDESQELLEDFFKGAEGAAALTQILQALAAQTPLDPVAGNPNSLLSRMGDRDFMRGTDYEEGFNMAAASSSFNNFGIEADTGWYSNDIADQNVTSAALTFSRHMPNAGFSLLIDLPLTYVESEGAVTYEVSLGVGARFPVTPKWALTPIIRVGGVGSEDLGAGAVIYSGAVVSDYRIPLDEQNEFQIGNLVGYYKTDGITVGDFSIDYDLQNVRFTNGVALIHSFDGLNMPLKARVFFNDTRFTGDSLFNDYYDEVGASFIRPFNEVSSLEIGGSYLFADGYDGVKVNLGVTF